MLSALKKQDNQYVNVIVSLMWIKEGDTEIKVNILKIKAQDGLRRFRWFLLSYLGAWVCQRPQGHFPKWLKTSKVKNSWFTTHSSVSPQPPYILIRELWCKAELCLWTLKPSPRGRKILSVLCFPDLLLETETNRPTKHFLSSNRELQPARVMLHVKHSLGDLLGEEKMVIPGVKYKYVCIKDRENEG